MLKSPRAPVSGFTPQVRRATPGTAQQVAKDTASNGLGKSRKHRAVTFQAGEPHTGVRADKERIPPMRRSDPEGSADVASPYYGASFL